MNFAQITVAAAIFAVSSTALAGDVIDLAPSQISGTLTGLDNIMFPEIIGSVVADSLHDFSVYANAEGVDETALYEGTLMTRVVRSNLTGLLTFNYMLMSPNELLSGAITHIEISGFEGFQTRVEYRNDFLAPGDEGPVQASRDASGDLIGFSFGSSLQTEEESKFFFVMLDTEEYVGTSIATIILESGESISIDLSGSLPTPGTFSLLSMAGLVSMRRRR